MLRGSVTATNISPRPWRITGKPTAILVSAVGEELKPRHMVGKEGRVRNWVVVQPGEAVRAPMSVSQWNGTELADYLVIKWPGGRKAAKVNGPCHPRERSDQPTYSSSSWFAPVR